MRYLTRSFLSTVASPIIGLTLLAVANQTKASDTIARGWDLFQTAPGLTTFFGQSFEGVPLGTFDFFGAIGVQNVGATDTLIRRLSTASVAGPGNSATIATVVDAFQLKSVNPVSILGGPLGIYYITLASLRGGPVSAGTMTINFGLEGDPHGTFSSSFDLFVDVRLGGLNGPILDSREVVIPDSGAVPWRHEATASIQIPGVNLYLGGAGNIANDFWVKGTVIKTTPNGGIGSTAAGVPDAGGALVLFAISLLSLGWFQKSRFLNA